MNKKNLIIAGVIALLVFIVVAMGAKIKSLKEDRDIYKHNFGAATEELNKEKMKNGDLLIERDSYVMKVKDLEKIGLSSEAEIKELKKKLDNNIIYISQLEGEISARPVVRDTVIITESGVRSMWTASDKPWYTINGWSESDGKRISTGIDEMKMSVPLKVGLTEDWTIFVRSSNPYVDFSSIDGAVLDRSLYTQKPKTRRVGFGVWAGINTGWDINTKDVYVGPGLGVGIYYRIF